MMDSELRELRKRKIKRIVLWTFGITAAAAIITIFTIFGLADLQGGGGG
jgi:hypothetical protein